jgi:hypothetical protein
MPAPLVRTKLVKVRCLGPGKSHNFLSKDQTRNRICPACAKSLAAVHIDREYIVSHAGKRLAE